VSAYYNSLQESTRVPHQALTGTITALAARMRALLSSAATRWRDRRRDEEMLRLIASLDDATLDDLGLTERAASGRLRVCPFIGPRAAALAKHKDMV
jgi:hypothetical protein